MSDATGMALVTGATGFIGSHVSRHLLNNGFRVRATYRNAPGIIGDAEWIRLPDLDRPFDWSEALDGVTAVVHAAGAAHHLGMTTQDHIARLNRINVEATRELALAARNSPSIRRVVFVSSIAAVTSESSDPITARTEPTPMTAYGESKLRAERELAAALEGSTTEWCAARPTMVYGAGQMGEVQRLARALRRGLPLPLAAIKNRRSFLYIGNLVEALGLCVTESRAANRTLMIADPEPISTRDFVELVAQGIGGQARLWPLPAFGLRATGRFGDMASRVFNARFPIDSARVRSLVGSLEVDISETKEALGWNPSFSTPDGLEHMFAQ
jgi:nucleoside-diphosphate-sugar epimerase